VRGITLGRSLHESFTGRRRSWIEASVLVIALTWGGAAAAQGTLGNVGRTIGSDVKTGLGDVWAIWTAPVHARPRDWAGAGAAAGTFLVTMPFDDDVDRFLLEHPSAEVTRLMVAVSDTGSFSLIKWGSAHRVLWISGALYGAGLVSGHSGLRDAGMGCAASMGASNVPRQVIYQVVARRRPRTASGDQDQWRLGHGDWEEHSFFAGHVANAMACATFVNGRFHLGAVEPVLYAYAVGVGLGRIADQRHWTSDTVLGTIFGYAVGRSIALRSKKRAEEKHERRSALTAPLRHLTAWQEGESLRVGWNAGF
jgi:PAP2 superfamily protein